MNQIHALQLDIVWRDKSKNFSRIYELLQKLIQSKSNLNYGDLLVLPEMFATGFDVEYGALAEGEGFHLEETDEFLSECAKKFQIYIQGSGIGRDSEQNKRRNLVRVFNPEGQVIASYQKIHPFSFGGEHKRFSSGEEVVIYEWNGFKVAPIICYDLRFPELFRKAVDLGATLFCVVANWPSPRQTHWKPLLQARAIENQAVVLGVNRSGQDQFLEYLGASVLFDEYGKELACLDQKESFLSHELSPKNVRVWRDKFPALKDRKDWL